MKKELHLTELSGDDPDFVTLTGRITRALASEFSPKQVVVVRIDNWFDRKWLAFSGIVFSGVGRWNEELTVPPFNANRVLEERHYQDSNGAWEAHGPGH